MGGAVPGAPGPGKPQSAEASSKDDLQALKEQLAQMQQKIDTLASK